MRQLFALVLLMLETLQSTQAGVMTKATLSQKFSSPYIVGDKDTELPVWPIFKQKITSKEPIGYLFESIDFISLPVSATTAMRDPGARASSHHRLNCRHKTARRTSNNYALLTLFMNIRFAVGDHQHFITCQFVMQQ